ncbi:Fe-S cluster assembly sulfur transfer protein SufU [Convivina praedatoris]|uniref:Iron-sulfur cluster assembly scaffold protein IscU n=1 Tax=Convivina praedatoris TaxID=2880963 RepID=A0ABN8H7R6_9LACO|nr:SUF system NifU family Fe-S cluster assembly protein [Convivina sp. LMG 32447]CAH1850261.1 Iron-sulfur cluster assembly scaffold protein IscU [Convivina sp. LMG 32447]CAH1850930.1 Iron-sulfur cluster assembly scaffold protein IscU [Convivina sp. LMG 32447]CAH1850945.1 Iron-sulfur cluster assembly scaffold protein IscU [Convivina sp. LMG 32447]
MTLHNLDQLYRQVIMTYAKHPHHFQSLSADTGQAVTKYNPTCGDLIKLTLVIENGRVQDLSFDGDGCAIFKASASMMTDLINHKSIEEVQRLSQQFSAMMTDGQTSAALGDACSLIGVRKFPTRIKCATLSWHALDELLIQN